MWADGADCLRVEISRDGKLERLGIRNEAHWWRWLAGSGETRGTVSWVQGLPTVPPLLDPLVLEPARFIANFKFSSVTKAEQLGRPVLVANARPRRSAPENPGTIRYDFAFDAEFGFPLRVVTTDEEGPVLVIEATSIRYGDRLAPDLFEVPISVDGQAAS